MTADHRWCPACRHVAHRHDAFGCTRCACTLANADAHASLPANPACACLAMTRAVRRGGAVTGRELVVLNGMAAGRTNGQIARDMAVTPDTVKTFARRIYRRLGAHDRAHAVAIGYTLGLLKPLEVAS